MLYNEPEYHYFYDSIIKLHTICIKYNFLLKHVFECLKIELTGENMTPNCLCISALCHALKSIYTALNNSTKTLNSLLYGFSQIKLIGLISEISKLSVLHVYMLAALKADPNEIYYQEPDSSDWRLLHSVLSIEVFPNVDENVAEFDKSSLIMWASLTKALKFSSEFGTFLAIIGYMIYLSLIHI